jgi:ppGpp synthetase/RelA/SpoT-type nucleotidyltranferase
MQGVDAIANRTQEEVEDRLAQIGLLSRVFGRAKTPQSMQAKLGRHPGKYSPNGKLIQDSVGVRVMLYFNDDVELAKTVLLSTFELVELVEDAPNASEFGPTRLNMVFRLGEHEALELRNYYRSDCVDSTFEVQVRTILSEGWHEVEHDLRYKHQEDWAKSPGLSRTLNGILATLETCDWTMLKLFEEKAHEHFRSREWLAMLRSKLRLRMTDDPISPELESLLEADGDLAREVFLLDRRGLVLAIAKTDMNLPLTPDNVLHLANHFVIKHPGLAARMPRALAEAL